MMTYTLNQWENTNYGANTATTNANTRLCTSIPHNNGTLRKKGMEIPRRNARIDEEK